MLIFQMRGLECKHLHRGDIQQLILEGSAASLRDQSETMAAAHPPGARQQPARQNAAFMSQGGGRTMTHRVQISRWPVWPLGISGKATWPTGEGTMQWEGLMSPKATPHGRFPAPCPHHLRIRHAAPSGDTLLSWPCLPLEPPAHAHYSALVAVL